MRNILSAAAFCLALANVHSAIAASVFFNFSGVVTGDIITNFPCNGMICPPIATSPSIPSNPIGDPFTGTASFVDPSPLPATFGGLLTPGQSVFVSVQFGQNNPFTINSEYATLSFFSNNFIGSVWQYYPEGDRPQSDGFFFYKNGSDIEGTLDLGSAGSIGVGQSLHLDITSLQVSGVPSVPLPPALPMFALALLALAIFGFVAHNKQRVSISSFS
jgi:hypothetical protein